MSSVTITLTDDSDGIKMAINYGAGFNVNSHAHQHAHLILKILDKLASKNVQNFISDEAIDAEITGLDQVSNH